jgi:hypothetical protein
MTGGVNTLKIYKKHQGVKKKTLRANTLQEKVQRRY